MSTETDYAPVGIIDDRDILLTSLRTGDTAAILTPIDFGVLTSGRWVIDAQSIPGLFTIAYNPATDTSARLVVANSALMPAPGTPVTVTAHYYDRYQIDGYGNPLPGKGFAETLVYTVEAGTTRELNGFGSDIALGSGSTAANPALATLQDGGIAAVWQGADNAVWARVQDAAGNAHTSAFALTSGWDGSAEGQPAVAALSGGRFVTAYTTSLEGQPRIAFKIADVNGNQAGQVLVDGGLSWDTSMPDVATLRDGSFAIAWRAGGQVHVRVMDANGNAVGAEQVYGSLGTAFSPSIAATGAGYTVSWGEIGDGNVHVAAQGGLATIVSGDGLAASVSTAAPLPSIAALADGGYVVAWDSYANEPLGFSMSDIFFQRYDAAGNKVGALTQANVDSGGGRFEAAVTALSDGGFVVAWQSSSGDFEGNGVFGRRFDAGGYPVDQREFAINEGRAGDQANPAITALANGGFATAWGDTNGSSSQVELRVLAGGMDPGGGSGWTGDSGQHLVAGIGSERLGGFAGVDTVSYAGVRSNFTVIREGSASATVIDHVGNSGVDTLASVERIAFSDASLALDIDGIAGKAYRLYQAAFNRTPDKGGVGYWIKMMDAGQTLEQVAFNFANSPEFKQMYGANASDAQFVELLYNNVLHRSAEGAGRDYWLEALGEKHLPRAQVLAYFSESAENQAQVIGAIQNGIEFTPWI
ncbi:DUF4214 domain-containing protein [Massilia sp. IC2-476]|uniref:DUF4214 domain-containing protein n=1 Tax=Massilia sp. IC2-476 TaxID=2887199 RepID=UPI001D11DC80|nr:DUF4214 domain-containing protein [Massilia sp. IC2-476]MCC2972097.1 DUF4214 domain-containing protein [Massilia sp. IC2-476]